MVSQERIIDLYERINPVQNLRRINEQFRLNKRVSYLYEVLCFVLIIFDSFFLFITVIFPLKQGALESIALFDAIVVLFLWIEYLFRVSNQEDKVSYVSRNWSDIIAIIPFDYIALVAFGVTQPVLLFRLLRLVRIVALLRFSRRIEKEVLAFAERTRLIYGLAIFLLVIIVGSVLLFNIEHGINPSMSTPDDTLWFMIATITSTGYGDVVPVTGIGRMIAVIAMVSAILFTSLVTATTTSALLEKFRKEREETQRGSEETIGDVMDKLDALNERMDEIKTEIDGMKEIKSDIQGVKALVDRLNRDK